jgi:hypothetical protein
VKGYVPEFSKWSDGPAPSTATPNLMKAASSAAVDGVDSPDKVQLPDKARAGIEVLHQVVESLLTTSRYVDEEGEATQALADLSACIADPPFRLAGSSTGGVTGRDVETKPPEATVEKEKP